MVFTCQTCSQLEVALTIIICFAGLPIHGSEAFGRTWELLVELARRAFGSQREPWGLGQSDEVARFEGQSAAGEAQTVFR